MEDGYANIVYYDPRGTKFGTRMICGKGSFKLMKNMEESTLEAYEKICKLYGVTSSHQMNNKLPGRPEIQARSGRDLP